MTVQNVYFALEKPDAFTRQQWQTAMAAVMLDLQRQRTERYVMPHEILHWATRADGNEILVDGLVETDRLQPAVVADTMAAAVGLSSQERTALRTEMATKRRRFNTVDDARTYRRENWQGE